MWQVSPSLDKPHGYKYSLVYIVKDKRIIGYDNGEGKGNHRHYRKKTVYFESIKVFRKAITPKRIELLHIIKEKHPKSIQELTRLANRDVKSVVTDIGILEELGLIDMKRKKDGRRESIPTVAYNKINLEIAV